MAISVAAFADEEVVPGSDPDAIHDLGEAANSAYTWFNLSGLFPVRMGGAFLDRRNPPGLLSPHAGIGQQSPAFKTRTRRRRGLQPEHLVARSPPAHRLGRKLARQPSRLAVFGPLQPPLVADRCGLVCDPRTARGFASK